MINIITMIIILLNISDEDDTESEILFRFQVPKLPDAVSETKFR